MKKHKFLFAILFALLSGPVLAQSSETIKKYIATYKDIAIEEMRRTGVPAAIKLAQGIHETGAGTSNLVLRSNNHFGIKCKTEWQGEKVYHDDDARGECFRKYDDPFQSYRDHSDFLKNRPYYADLFKLDPTDYEGWAYGLKKAGYATNPKYPQILIKLIRDYNLQDYTLIALGQKQDVSNDVIWASHTNVEKTESADAAKAAVLNEKDIDLTGAYPSGVFQINNTKVILVEKGTAFLKIAEEHQLSLSRLFEFNDMQPVDIASRDQLIYLQRKRKTGANEFHLVAEGETLHDIAQKQGIRIENLADYNHMETNSQPAAGEKLYLQSKAPAAPRLADEKAAKKETPQPVQAKQKQEPQLHKHKVQTGETLYSISRKYGVTVEELVQWNELQSYALMVGQELKIYK